MIQTGIEFRIYCIEVDVFDQRFLIVCPEKKVCNDVRIILAWIQVGRKLFFSFSLEAFVVLSASGRHLKPEVSIRSPPVKNKLRQSTHIVSCNM